MLPFISINEMNSIHSSILTLSKNRTPVVLELTPTFWIVQITWKCRSNRCPV